MIQIIAAVTTCCLSLLAVAVCKQHLRSNAKAMAEQSESNGA